MKCAFLSISNTDGWFIDDDLVHTPLQDLGWTVQNIPWDTGNNWDEFDLVVIRSTWDYQNHLQEFLSVLNNIDNSRAILLNDIELVKWNINKNYLFELEEKGIRIVPTIKFNSPSKCDIRTAFEEFNAEALIIKPIIGANADDTFWIKDQDQNLDEIISIFKDRVCLIQPFMSSIVKEGEYSMMFFQGQLSHTILKSAKSGDYRIQEEHGGTTIQIENPDPALVQLANETMNLLPMTPLYARVDMVRTEDDLFALMELELIEPSLYFKYGEESARRFAECIDRYWKSTKLHQAESMRRN